MKSLEGLTEKQISWRKKIAEKFQERRRKGYERWLKKKRREKAKKEALEKKKKEKEKEKKRLAKEKERLAPKNKKKVGRPKKRGPKINYYKRNKKRNAPKKKGGPPKLPPFKYKIFSCRNGVQNRYIGKYRSIEDAYDVLNRLKLEDENIVFQSLITGVDSLENSIDEYILIEKSDAENTFLRNEYGKLVEQQINIDGWVVVDKYRYKREETFWVWGYDKKDDRKTFSWIYENVLFSGIETAYDFKRVLIYKNKIVFKHDNGKIDLIICKHPSDSVRFYNMLEGWIKRDKIKQIVFIGDYSALSERRRKLELELLELTGWTLFKLRMSTNSFFNYSRKLKNK